MAKIFGDGIHDAQVIQQLLDGKGCCVSLPSVANVVQDIKMDMFSCVMQNYGILKTLRVNNVRTNKGEVYLNKGETYEFIRN